MLACPDAPAIGHGPDYRGSRAEERRGNLRREAVRQAMEITDGAYRRLGIASVEVWRLVRRPRVGQRFAEEEARRRATGLERRVGLYPVSLVAAGWQWRHHALAHLSVQFLPGGLGPDHGRRAIPGVGHGQHLSVDHRPVTTPRGSGGLF